jgi:hypothetical protein
MENRITESAKETTRHVVHLMRDWCVVNTVHQHASTIIPIPIAMQLSDLALVGGNEM